MPNWITITISDLYNSQAAALIDACNLTSMGAGQQSRVPGIISDVTVEIRRRVAKCNQLDMLVTAIPSGLKSLAVDMIFCRLKTAMQMALSDDERALLKRRCDELDRIADGRDLVDPPDNPIAASFVQTIPSPAFSTRTTNGRREFTRRSQDG